VESGSGWYVYGVVPDEGDPDLFQSAEGVDSSQPVGLLAQGPLAAIVSSVPLSEFGEGSLQSHLHDPVWLEEKVRAHDAVLEAALGRIPLVPFRFGTIYRGEEQVRAMLREHGELTATLKRLGGKIELGVKGFLDPEQFDAHRAEEAPAGPGGTAYLLRKQAERDLAEAREAFRVGLAHEAHGRLAAAATDARANPVQRPEVAGRPGEMFLNAAYLVSVEGTEGFRSVLGELRSSHASDGVEYELTGPWPPYNFVSEEDGQ
jgi:Gas vesicle synthesis protein GvpL/GvpF